MEYTYLGRTGLKVSKLVLGTMNFGMMNTIEESFEIMDKALEAGITFFDTADIYGHEPRIYPDAHAGFCEEIIGKWFAQDKSRREKVILATKSYFPVDDPNEGPNAAAGLSAYKIRTHLEKSLARLQTDHIDLYYMHHYDPHMPIAEAWDTFDALTDQGKIFYTGASNFGARHIQAYQDEAKARHRLGLAADQFQYNLFSRLPEVELIPGGMEEGIASIVWSPLAGGKLSGKIVGSKAVKMDFGYTQGKEGDARYFKDDGSSFGSRSEFASTMLGEAGIAQLQAYADLCAQIGESESNVAIAWLLNNPGITAVITGARTPEQLDEVIHAAEIKLPEDFVQKLDEIFPGPGGSAPAVYQKH